MKTIAILLSLAAAATPVQPKLLVTVRADYVYTFAKDACPKELDVVVQQKDDPTAGPAFLNRLADLSQMTTEERSLLLHMCALYAYGAGYGVSHPVP